MDEFEVKLPGIKTDDDESAKEEVGNFYEALRLLTVPRIDAIRPWADLSPSAQFLVALMLSDKKSPAHRALMTLTSFIAFVNTSEGELAAVAVANKLAG